MADQAGAWRAGGSRSLVVDARGLDLTGIGRYLGEVLRPVLQRGDFGRVRLLGEPARLEAYLAEVRPAAAVEIVPFPYHFYDPRVHLAWAALALKGVTRADAAFFPHYDVPVLGPVPRLVVTVHDLMHFRLPEFFPAHKRVVASWVLRRAVRRASRVLMVSEHARRDLLAMLPWAADRIVVVPNGVDPGERSASPAAVTRARELGPYLLCVGNRKPHKNLISAVDVLARLRPERPSLRLVIAGPSYRDGDGVAARARALGVDPGVVELGRVDDDLLRALYREAECLLFPSVYEGFGIPVLEAMAAGTPVVASNRTSIPEVVGDAGALCDPFDVEGMAAAVRQVWRGAPGREARVRQGRARAAGFSWRAAADRTHEVLLDTASMAARPAPG